LKFCYIAWREETSFGSRKSFIAALSTCMCEGSTSWNSEAIAINLYLHSIDARQNLGEKKHYCLGKLQTNQSTMVIIHDIVS